MAYKIMVIDDEQMILDMLRDQFELEQYQVITAKSASEAISKLHLQPNLILLDINMPDMDGLQLCKKIRNDVTCPILFLTARLEEADRVAGLRAGGDDYIMKPFRIIIIVYANPVTPIFNHIFILIYVIFIFHRKREFIYLPAI